MPWTLYDYPNSWKNFEPLERKKAIDIGNALLKDGYDESTAIPIATKQAESWYQDATKKEREALEDKDVTQHKKDKDARPKLNDNDVEVYQEDDKWKVRTYGAKRAADEYDTKEKAVQRAEEIAKNRNTQVHVKS
ncbi:DUF2188 domain-containing protein [Staphylococcus sp. IVB6181]|uniref:DUF2188 domain-containing protein n=1 Tax=Staphylococcus sp. IVB6181 TaxID=2929481 RepID=UPI0021D0D9BB|nr:DUF2188 domain-containing protein [Staphylococcus sp. IVB6181]UXV35462.1 DUF2188 domain-containing protein [Staphylococcus sp. IVB6181]